MTPSPPFPLIALCFFFFKVMITSSLLLGLPRCLCDKESTCQCKRHGFDPWVVNIPWRRTKHQQHTTNFSYVNVFCCVVVQSLSGASPFATPWTAAHQAPLSFTVSCSLLKFMSRRATVRPSSSIPGYISRKYKNILRKIHACQCS